MRPDLINLTIDIEVVSSKWSNALPDLEATCRQAIIASFMASDTVLSTAVCDRPTEVSVRLSDDDEVFILNKKFRSKPNPTNVLSFPGISELELEGLPVGAPILLGDVIMAFGMIQNEARQAKKPLIDHFRHICIHGILHLLGYSHTEDYNARVMEELESAVLAELKKPNPCAAIQAGDKSSQDQIDAGGTSYE